MGIFLEGEGRAGPVRPPRGRGAFRRSHTRRLLDKAHPRWREVKGRMRTLTRLVVLVWGVGASAAPQDSAPLDLSGLSETARHEVTQVMTEEFCGCGAPHTLAICVQSHTGCHHSLREVQLAASLAERGATASELGVMLARYNLSFREARQKLPVDDRMCMGEAHAPMTLVEYADFECPICGVSRPILEKFVQERKGQVRLCYLPFPLP